MKKLIVLVVLIVTAYAHNSLCMDADCQILVDINHQDKNGDTPLHTAVKNDADDTTINRLVSRPGIDLTLCNKNGNSAYKLATGHRHKCADMILQLLNKRVVKAFAKPPYDHEEIEKLFHAGASMSIQDEDGNTPLHKALLDGRDETVIMLLLEELHTDLTRCNKAGQFPLDVAKDDAYRQLIQKRLDSELFRAIHCSKNYVERHLLAGADINTQDEEGNTPLHKAITGQAEDKIINCLLSFGQST